MYFTIQKDRHGFRARIYSAGGEVVWQSEAYGRKTSAENTIKGVLGTSGLEASRCKEQLQAFDASIQPLRIELEEKARKDLRRFGLLKAFFLRDELHALREDPNLLSRLHPLPPYRDPIRFRIDLPEDFVARARIVDQGLVIEEVITQKEIYDTAEDFFQEEE